jgi:hypothetical protein
MGYQPIGKQIKAIHKLNSVFSNSGQSVGFKREMEQKIQYYTSFKEVELQKTKKKGK